MLHSNYTLESYRGVPKLFRCPACGQQSLQRHVYKKTGLQVANEVGCCIRKKCGYCYNPIAYFKENNLLPNPKGSAAGPSLIPEHLFRRSLSQYEQSDFSAFLSTEFGEEAAKATLQKYSVGTSKRWPRSTVFWQLDKFNRVRTGRIISITRKGLIVNQCIPLVTYVHDYLKIDKFNAVQCLFGEHLLRKDIRSAVVIVNDERTAVIGSIIYSDFIWLASAGCNFPNADMCQSVSGRATYWYPNSGFEKLKAFIKW